ncbi:hypothetical protein TVAG_444290 [Trichomonas vaginalis G3]|uniref:Uncharacterized protein n=1 Tax=Trichomonas vaginalis (strain ATCC PRA-98 / G3) TaxID=412133 RepID=A2E2H1_TRIV3|nr:hypothetical protein TVAGG3_0306040 [Trichomonas vaginalis G3]EAY13146.1 hypothetical protein TVAG_444290 [Trichomonas vaginalis G3]KAI5528260.1 hypothetical protein TVAGG3_0306040 [Trichomonas vaginalis G3]|eukprot:XP_001325369.1 hypothetical protein [Trichomonas vaginalis G3]
MQGFVTEFARKPYLVPDSGNSQPYVPTYQYGESNTSILILDGGDRNSWNNDLGDLDVKNQNLEKNLPIMVRLQENKLEPGPKLALHDGGLALFVSMIQDTTIHPYSLCPFPKIEIDDINYVITNMVDTRAPPDRASWILHYLARYFDYNVDITTKLLEFNYSDDDYFAKFCYYSYKRNILNCYDFLTGIIQKMKPTALKIFKDEILHSHQLCALAFSKQDEFMIGDTPLKAKQIYLNMLNEDMCLQKTHLIQFSILHAISGHIPVLYDYSISNDLNKLMMNMKSENRRCRQIYQAINTSMLPPSLQLQNLIISNYPTFDVKKIKNGAQRIIAYIPYTLTNTIIFDLLEIPFWFPENNGHLAAAIIYVIQMLPKAKLNMKQLVDFVYQHVDEIACFKHTFAELQAANLVNYSEFISKVQFSSNFTMLKAETINIVSTLPFYGLKKENNKAFNNAMRRLGSDEYNSALKFFLTNISNLEQTILANKNVMEQIPYATQYSVGSFVVGNTKMFSEALDIIMTFNLATLFPVLVENIYNSTEYKLSITHKILAKIIESIPILILHGFFQKFVEIILNNPTNSTITELVTAIHDKYKDIVSLQDKYKETYSQIVKNKNVNISTENIRNFFRRFSYLCSLHVFDAFHSIDNQHDFEAVFPTFLTNLLMFRSLKSSTFINFFEEFTESGCISQPSSFFVKILLNVLLSFKENDFTDHVVSVVSDFFSYIFKHGHYLPMNYLSECRRKRYQPEIITKLISILIASAQKNPEVFNPYNSLNDSTVKNFSNDLPLLSTFISVLCDNSHFPQLTADLIHQFDSSTSQPISLPGCFFSMLPEEARGKSFEESFEFMKTGITRENAKLIGYWLKFSIFYTIDNQNVQFPVVFQAPDRNLQTKYMTQVSEAFFGLFNSISKADENANLYLFAWSTILHVDRNRRSELYSSIYSTPVFANAAVQVFQTHFAQGDINFGSAISLFIHPVIQIAAIISFDQLIDNVINSDYASTEFENFTQLATMISIVYITRCQNKPNTMRIESIACKILEWVRKATVPGVGGKLDFLLDSFNFIMCYSTNIKEMADIRMQQSLNLKIRDNYMMLPELIQKKVILNIPPQSFQMVQDPLYFHVTLPQPVPQFQMDIPPQFPPPPSAPQQQPTLNMSMEPTIDMTNLEDDDFMFQWQL